MKTNVMKRTMAGLLALMTVAGAITTNVGTGALFDRTSIVADASTNNTISFGRVFKKGQSAAYAVKNVLTDNGCTKQEAVEWIEENVSSLDTTGSLYFIYAMLGNEYHTLIVSFNNDGTVSGYSDMILTFRNIEYFAKDSKVSIYSLNYETEFPKPYHSDFVQLDTQATTLERFEESIVAATEEEVIKFASTLSDTTNAYVVIGYHPNNSYYTLYRLSDGLKIDNYLSDIYSRENAVIYYKTYIPENFGTTRITADQFSEYDDTPVSVSDFPGFKAVSFDEAKKWSGIPEQEDAILIYDVSDEGYKYIRFYYGKVVWVCDTYENHTRGSFPIIIKTQGASIYYTTELDSLSENSLEFVQFTSDISEKTLSDTIVSPSDDELTAFIETLPDINVYIIKKQNADGGYTIYSAENHYEFSDSYDSFAAAADNGVVFYYLRRASKKTFSAAEIAPYRFSLNDYTDITPNDFPEHKAISLDEAKAWRDVPKTGDVTLFYDVSVYGVKYVAFTDGEIVDWITDYSRTTHSRVVSNMQNYGTRYFYTTAVAAEPLTKVEAVSPTCTEDGNREYWYDEKNDRYYADDEGKFSITKDDVIIKAEHTYGQPVWEWRGSVPWATFTCSVCGEKSTVAGRITTTVQRLPTAEHDGYTKDNAVVHFNSSTYTTSRTIYMPQLVLTHVDAVAPTCTQDGNIECWYCESNGWYYTDERGIFDSRVKKNATVIAATGHNFGAPEWTWNDDNTATAKFTCEKCGEEYIVTADITNSVIEPTYTNEGKEVYTATVVFEGETYTDTNEIKLLDKLTYTAPTVTYEKGDKSVYLNWTKIEGAEKYAVCGIVNGKWKKLAETSGTSYNLKNLVPGTDYTVAVVGMINGTWYTDFSNAVTVASKANPDFTYTPRGSSIDMTWNACDGAEKYAVCGKVNGKWKKLAETSETSYNLKNLAPDTEYMVAVICMYNGSWYADFSKAKTASSKTNDVNTVYPEIISAVRESGSTATIEWKPVANAEQYGVAILVGSKWTVCSYTDSDTTTFTGTNLKAGTVYTLAVCAKVNGKWNTTNIEERAIKV